MTLPEPLQRTIALFSEGSRIMRNEGELFASASWVAVMLGQNVSPRAIDPLVAALPVADIEPKLNALRKAMSEYARTLPAHEDALRSYCGPL
jgi:tryptophan halogenase